MKEEIAQETIRVIQSSGKNGSAPVGGASQVQTVDQQRPTPKGRWHTDLPATLSALSAFYLLSPSPFSRSQATLWRDCGAMGTGRSPRVA